MAKVKISKKSTRIDMTAMCDVAFLLLSFFIMTATAKQPEPKVVDAPASTVEVKLPEEGVAVLTVGDGQVFLTIPGADVRREALKRISAKYNIAFTEEEYKKFSTMEGFGVPLNELKGLLKLSVDERNRPELQKGIPYADSTSSQLFDWVKEARMANKTLRDAELTEGKIDQDKFAKTGDLQIAIKGDGKEEYPTIKKVMDILQAQDKNKFFLVTNLRDENF
ncbi:ExbD/TolR family protein [Flavobacterium hauense]